MYLYPRKMRLNHENNELNKQDKAQLCVLNINVFRVLLKSDMAMKTPMFNGMKWDQLEVWNCRLPSLIARSYTFTFTSHHLVHSKPVEKWKADTTTINKSLIIRVWSKRPVSETDTQICSAFFNDHFCGVDVLHQCLYRGFHQSSKNMFTFTTSSSSLYITIIHYHHPSCTLRDRRQHASHICHCHTPPTCHPILRKRYERLDMLLVIKKRVTILVV